MVLERLESLRFRISSMFRRGLTLGADSGQGLHVYWKRIDEYARRSRYPSNLSVEPSMNLGKHIELEQPEKYIRLTRVCK